MVESVDEDQFCDEEVASGTPVLVPKLFDVTVDSDLDDSMLKAVEEAQPIPFGAGIAGHVALTKTGLRINDVYKVGQLERRTNKL